MENENAKSPTSWWQWLLVYPTLGVALVSAIPTWIDHYQASKKGVSTAVLDIANEQDRLWQANIDCTKTLDFRSIKNQHSIEVGAHVCPSGDVLVFIKQPNSEKGIYRWVGLKTFVKTASLLIHQSVAYAGLRETVLAQGFASVINQRWLQPGMLKQRIRYPNGACADQVINTYTGGVVSQTPVGCNDPF